MPTQATELRAASVAGTRELSGLGLGLLAVAAFSLTLPATRVAVESLSPALVGVGRSFVAALLAAPLLWMTRQRRPTAEQCRRLGYVILGAIFGFPLLTAWAMQHTSASHGAAIIGLLPLATAIIGAWRAGERPSARFWLAGVAGSAIVVGFALSAGAGSLSLADLAIFAAVLMAGVAYAEGARLAREMGGWQVICWALVLALPLLAPLTIWLAWQHGLPPPSRAWLGFGYVSLVSAFFGFFAWYRALAIGGVCRVSQLQLLQPFMTILFSSAWLGERIDTATIACAVAVAASVIMGRRAA
ncbi:MAG: DMT family transporter [Rhodocyclaceae bacterium]